MKYPLLVMIIYFLLPLSSLHSQEEWRHLTTDDGLNGNKVLTIYQAKNGNIWVGTDRGVNRYNGVFEDLLSHPVNAVFESPTGELLARVEILIGDNSIPGLYFFDNVEWDEVEMLKDSHVSDLPEFSVESTDKLWIVASDGLVGFDGQKWEQYDTGADVDVSWLAQTSDGRLWSASWQQGIVSFDGQKWTTELNLDNSLLSSAVTNTVLVTSTGKILLGTNEGLFQYDPILKMLTDLKLDKVNVTQIFETNSQSLWIGTDDGLYQLGEQNWQHVLKGQAVNVIKQRVNGELWVGTGNGLYLFQGGKWVQEITAAINCITELRDGTIVVGSNSGLRMKRAEEVSSWNFQFETGKMVVGLLNASDGTLWCRSDAGILSYDGVSWTNQSIVHNLSAGTSEDWEGNIYEAQDGTIWFGGLFIFSYQDGVLKRHNTDAWAFFIEETDDGDIWVGGGRGGPYRYNGTDWTLLEGYGGNVDNRPWGFHQAADGVIWAQGVGGIWSYDGIKWEGTELTQISARSQRGEVFFEDKNGTLWAGSNPGIHRLDENGQWVKSIETGGKIRMIEESSQGMLVAVDQENGLLIYDGNQWSKHPSYGSSPEDWMKSTLHATVGGIFYRNRFGKGFAEYPSGVFWLATDRGVRRIENDFWYDLTVADGLPGSDVRCVEKDDQGNLWVGTGSGLVKFTPSSNQNPPAVQLTWIDGEDISSLFSSDTDKRIYTTGSAFVTLRWSGGDIETLTDRLNYQYKLDGIWSEVLKQNSTTIGLENGTHQFSIRAFDHHFNVSSLDSVTIIAKTDEPDPNINFPASGEILRGQIYIKGNIVDDDFAAYQVFITEVSKDKAPNLETEKALFQAESLPRTITLAIWKTEDFADNDYKIWLLAQDELEHKNSTEVIVRVDNTLPTVNISSPKANERVLKQTTITASVSDIHLNSYRLDYTTDSATNDWDQIFLQAGLYRKNEDGLLRQPELQSVEIERDWEIPIPEGSVRIRLTAIDIAGNTNSQTIQVEIPTAVVTRKGGIISPEDQQAELYFPPNTLAQDEIVTVNALPEGEVEPPVRRISQVYDFAPTTLRLNAIKPATLTLSYDASQLSAGKEPVIFHRTDGPWKAIGGTPNLEQQTISAAVLSLGQYTLGEMDKIEALDSANLKPDSLTCQPRVFSPKGNAFSTHTTVSFTLDQPANVSIKVYNVAGQLVEWLAQQQTFGSGKQAIHWDGRDSDGEIVATGLYIVTVTVGDQRQDKLVNVWNH